MYMKSNHSFYQCYSETQTKELINCTFDDWANEQV